MSEIKHTAGPWERQGTVIYALQHHGWRKGEEQFCNRFYASVQAGPGCVAEEAEAVATVMHAAPELLTELESLYTWLGDYTFDWPGRNTAEGQARLIRMRDLIAKAAGRSKQDVQDDYGTRAAIARRESQS